MLWFHALFTLSGFWAQALYLSLAHAQTALCRERVHAWYEHREWGAKGNQRGIRREVLPLPPMVPIDSFSRSLNLLLHIRLATHKICGTENNFHRVFSFFSKEKTLARTLCVIIISKDILRGRHEPLDPLHFLFRWIFSSQGSTEVI